MARIHRRRGASSVTTTDRAGGVVSGDGVDDIDIGDVALDSPSDGLKVSPRVWMVIALVSLAMSLGALRFRDEWVANVVGYIVVVVGALIGITMFRRATYRRQNLTGVAPSKASLRLAIVVVAMGIALAVAHAGFCAYQVATL